VKKVEEILHNHQKTTFVIITIPEAMGVEETKDLARDLKKYKISSKHIIINNIVPKAEHVFLKTRREVQDKYIEEIKSLFPNNTFTEIELQAQELKGINKLTELGEELFK